MDQQSQNNSERRINWSSIGAWIIDLIKALRGGPGRFYAYTFAAGMIAIGGAPWWAPLADFLIRSATGNVDGTKLPEITQVSPWFVAGCGFTICLLSMFFFHKTLVKSGLSAAPKEGYVRMRFPEESRLCDGIELIAELSDVPIHYSNVSQEHLNAKLRHGEFEWKSLEDALEGLNILVVDVDHYRLVTKEIPGGLQLISKGT